MHVVAFEEVLLDRNWLASEVTGTEAVAAGGAKRPDAESGFY